MKFDRCQIRKDRRIEPTQTELKREKNKIGKKIQKELNSMPLLAPIMTEEVESKYSKSELEIKEAKVKQLSKIQSNFQEMRDYIAQSWRKFRKNLRELSVENQKEFLEYWDNARFPKSSEYALDCLHQYKKKNNL